jgi:hypothetical protein
MLRGESKMLTEFRVENHRSIRDEQVFTMLAGRSGDPGDSRPRQVAGSGGFVLPVAGFYGANASGKSNVLSALRFMRDAVVVSHRLFPPDGGVPREPFAWGEKSTEPSVFEVTLVLNEARYQYGFVVDDTRFHEEWLFAWPKGRKQIWFERENDTYKFGEHLQGENRVVKEFTRSNALFLSAAVQHRHEQLGPLYRWFRDLRTVNVSGMRRYPFGVGGMPPERWLVRRMEAASESSRQQTLFDDDSTTDDSLEGFRELIRAADFGIVGFKVKDDDGEKDDRLRKRSGGILVQHHSETGEAWLPLAEESQGTRTMFRLGSVLVETLRRGGLLVVDELEASLHPLLALQIVKQFNDPGTNPENAQIVFATHDTNLLGTTTGDAPLRRDQVWLTEKDGEGATVVYPLTDFKPRKAENLERGYLQGRYGAIPFLGDFARWKD